MTLSTRTVADTFIAPDLSARGGTVTFTPTQPFYNSGSNQWVYGPYVATLTSGAFSITIPATDDADTTPDNATYTVLEELTGCQERSYQIEIPSAGSGTIQLGDLTPVQSTIQASYATTAQVAAITSSANKVSRAGDSFTGNLVASNGATITNLPAPSDAGQPLRDAEKGYLWWMDQADGDPVGWSQLATVSAAQFVAVKVSNRMLCVSNQGTVASNSFPGIGGIYRAFSSTYADNIEVSAVWTGTRPMEVSPLVHVSSATPTVGLGAWTTHGFPGGDPILLMGYIGNPPDTNASGGNLSLLSAAPFSHIDSVPRRISLVSINGQISAWVENLRTGDMDMLIGSTTFSGGHVGVPVHGIAVDTHYIANSTHFQPAIGADVGSNAPAVQPPFMVHSLGQARDDALAPARHVAKMVDQPAMRPRVFHSNVLASNVTVTSAIVVQSATGQVLITQDGVSINNQNGDPILTLLDFNGPIVSAASGSISFNTARLTAVGNPTGQQDAATRNWVTPATTSRTFQALATFESNTILGSTAFTSNVTFASSAMFSNSAGLMLVGVAATGQPSIFFYKAQDPTNSTTSGVAMAIGATTFGPVITWGSGSGNTDTTITRAAPAVLQVANAVALPERSTDPDAIANTGILYCKDSGGKTVLFCRFGTGAAQQVAIEP